MYYGIAQLLLVVEFLVHVTVAGIFSRCLCFDSCCGKGSLCGRVINNRTTALLGLILLTICCTNSNQRNHTDCNYPVAARNLSCRIFDYEYMNCSWDLQLQYTHEKDINVKCEYYNSSDVSAFYASHYYKSSELSNCPPTQSERFGSCPQLNRTWCFWNETNYHTPTRLLLKVVVNNERRPDITPKAECKEFSESDIVEPAPVKNLTFTNSNDQGCVGLQWTITKATRNYTFEIKYTSACSEMASTQTYQYQGSQSKVNNIVNVSICSLNPYTVYKFTVKRRVLDNKQLEKGYWSQETHESYKTDSDVIETVPDTSLGLHELTDVPGKDEQKSLKVYWKPLLDCQLHDSPDHVTYTVQTDDAFETVRHPAFSADIRVQERPLYGVTIRANNSVGSRMSVTRFMVFSIGPSPSELLVEFNRTGNMCTTYASMMLKDNNPLYTDFSHTVVWCKGNQLYCSSPPEWQRLDSHTTYITIPGKHCDGFRYGLVTHSYNRSAGRTVSSGIQWQPCVYELGKVPLKPVDNVAMATIQPDQGFAVVWKPYDCQVTSVYITHYAIKYCQTGNVQKCTCNKMPVYVNVSRESDMFTARDLQVGATFCMWVAGVSKSGVGPYNAQPIARVITNRTGSDTVLVVLVLCGALVGIGMVLGGGCFIRKKIVRCNKEAKIKLPEQILQNGGVPLLLGDIGEDTPVPSEVNDIRSSRSLSDDMEAILGEQPSLNTEISPLHGEETSLNNENTQRTSLHRDCNPTLVGYHGANEDIYNINSGFSSSSATTGSDDEHFEGNSESKKDADDVTEDTSGREDNAVNLNNETDEFTSQPRHVQNRVGPINNKQESQAKYIPLNRSDTPYEIWADVKTTNKILVIYNKPDQRSNLPDDVGDDYWSEDGSEAEAIDIKKLQWKPERTGCYVSKSSAEGLVQTAQEDHHADEKDDNSASYHGSNDDIYNTNSGFSSSSYIQATIRGADKHDNRIGYGGQSHSVERDQQENCNMTGFGESYVPFDFLKRFDQENDIADTNLSSSSESFEAIIGESNESSIGFKNNETSSSVSDGEQTSGLGSSNSRHSSDGKASRHTDSSTGTSERTTDYVEVCFMNGITVSPNQIGPSPNEQPEPVKLTPEKLEGVKQGKETIQMNGIVKHD